MFSKKIGVSDGLGLHECMATINDGQEDELQVLNDAYLMKAC